MSSHRVLGAFVALVLLVSAHEAYAAKKDLAIDVPIMRTFLDNGLEVIISEDHTSPTVATVLLYRVGAKDEVKGSFGFAHLFEHMMFEGTQAAPKGVMDELIGKHGGTLNAGTSNDYTVYWTVLPSNKLELALWLESDRMKSLEVTKVELKNQLDTVIEELHQSYLNQPYGKVQLMFPELFYAGTPYGHPVIGYENDLVASKLEDVQAFHDTYYSPSNCIMVIAGDVDPAKALDLVKEYFAPIPKAPKPPAPTFTVPDLQGPKAVTVEDAYANVPVLFMNWQVPPSGSDPSYPLELAASVLAEGYSSRLHVKLVEKEQKALQVMGYTGGRMGPDFLRIVAVPSGGEESMEPLQKSIEAEIDAIKKDGITAEEMDKVMNTIVTDYTFSVRNYRKRAVLLAMFSLFFDDPARINTEIAKYEAVTVDDVKAAVAKYVVPANQVVLKAIPAPAGAPKGGTAQ